MVESDDLGLPLNSSHLTLISACIHISFIYMGVLFVLVSGCRLETSICGRTKSLGHKISIVAFAMTL